jgi:trans-aconitate 2-methyltransferase
MSDWNPDQYRKFDAERSLPFWELIGLIEPTNPDSTASASGFDRMIDLGCGDGELTAAAVERLGVRHAVGLDSSPAMLDRTSSRQRPGLHFELGNLATWTSDADYDVVLANASLQWVPDHDKVIARWTDALKPGGQLAVQVPANGAHASHLVANEGGATEPFLSAMGGTVPVDPSAAHVLSPERYAEVLFELGYETQHVRLRVYPHVLHRSADVVEWVRGTNLNRFFERLPAELHEPFVDTYRSALLQRIGSHEPYLYAFKRILMWARRAA